MTSVWKLEFVVLGYSAEIDMITGHITDGSYLQCLLVVTASPPPSRSLMMQVWFD